MIKKIFKYIGILLLGLILAMVMLPFVFKDELIDKIKSLANEELNATVDFSDVGLSFFKSFPQVYINIEDLSIMGAEPFDSLYLIKTKSLNFSMNISPLYDNSAVPSISYIGLQSPDIHIVVLDSVTANYNITKPDTSASSPYLVKLDAYDLKDAKITYEDKSNGLYTKIENLTHSGSGDFTESVFDLDTKSDFESLTISMDGFKYLDKIKGYLYAKINMNNASSTYTLKDNELRLNELVISGNGTVAIKEEDILVKAQIQSKKTDFNSLVSVIPYLPLDPNMKVDGSFDAHVLVDGVYNANSMPGFDLKLNASNGAIQYPDLPYPVERINGNIRVVTNKPSWSDMAVDIKNLTMMVNQEQISANLFIDNATIDPHVRGNLNGSVNLPNWTKALPIEGLESIEGTVNSNLLFDAKMSDVEANNFANVKFEGDFIARDILYKTSGQPAIKMAHGILHAEPSRLDFKTTDLNLGTSTMDLNGVINNPLAYFSDKVDITGDMNLKADKIDMNEWLAPTTTATEPTATSEDISKYKTSKFKVNGTIGTFVYDAYELNALGFSGNVGLDAIDVDRLNFKIAESDFDIKGKLVNVLDYMNGQATLLGEIDFQSHYLNANQFMTEEPAAPEAEITTFEVPKDVKVAINTNIKKLTYTNYDIDNLSGTMEVANQAINMQDVKGDIIGGRIGFDGLYKTTANNPVFDMKFDMSNMKFSKAYETFISIQALAPIAKFIDGIFNTTLIFSGNLTMGMVPDFNTIDASGYLETINSSINNAQPIMEVGNKLNIDALKNLKLENTKNWFEIKQGTVELKERPFNVAGINSKIKGNHRITGDMAYIWDMAIPRKMLQQNQVTNQIDKGIGLLEKEASKLGVNLNQGEFINLRAEIGGKLLKPTIKIIPLGSSGNSIKDEVEATIDQAIETAKDSITKVVNNKKEEAMDTIRKTAEKELDKAKDKAINEGEKVLDKAKEQAKDKIQSKIDSTIKTGTTDTLVNKAKDILEKNTGTNADEIKDKIKDWNPFKKKKGGG